MLVCLLSCLLAGLLAGSLVLGLLPGHVRLPSPPPRSLTPSLCSAPLRAVLTTHLTPPLPPPPIIRVLPPLHTQRDDYSYA